mmetsp:Transcript_9811/g.14775  ORF Transcript_9811/g.14775 Transcript_9811/m.14775 type:complete len:235 (+) Transcript_9811:120-824(+)
MTCIRCMRERSLLRRLILSDARRLEYECTASAAGAEGYEGYNSSLLIKLASVPWYPRSVLILYPITTSSVPREYSISLAERRNTMWSLNRPFRRSTTFPLVSLSTPCNQSLRVLWCCKGPGRFASSSNRKHNSIMRIISVSARRCWRRYNIICPGASTIHFKFLRLNSPLSVSRIWYSKLVSTVEEKYPSSLELWCIFASSNKYFTRSSVTSASLSNIVSTASGINLPCCIKHL